ncbi:PEP-CTERM sorting domain-containing protein [Spirulina subsalsa]|uniref:PEP-CTERM sorting domain-containing protein n=1 Tax=Spirulina subsalsa TaxID=54311 RepID=UPI0003036144|nr:PEP-CTERM sorting domain-containing protein [Spirulina subsalsa]
MNNLSTLVKNTAISAGVAIAASTFFAATPADAFTMRFDPALGGAATSDYTGSTGELKFDFLDAGNDSVKILLTISNTTPSEIGSSLVGFTFDQFDWMETLSYTYDDMGTNFTRVFDPVTMQPFGSFDFGIRTTGNGNFQGGSANLGLREGNSAQVAFTFQKVGKTASELESLFSSAYEKGELRSGARFQQVGPNQADSDIVLGHYFQSVEIPPEEPVVSVPEPTVTLGLGMFALGALGAGRKNRKSEC